MTETEAGETQNRLINMDKCSGEGCRMVEYNIKRTAIETLEDDMEVVGMRDNGDVRQGQRWRWRWMITVV